MEKTTFEIKLEVRNWVLGGRDSPTLIKFLDDLDKVAFKNGFEAGRRQGHEDLRNKLNDFFRV